MNKYKRIELLSYYCIKRIYEIDHKQILMWIVIGKGHTRYKKFKSQQEAFNYFRTLKKFAKMDIQSIKDWNFVKTIYSFLELQYMGNKFEVNNFKKPKPQEIDNSIQYSDQYSIYDVELSNEEYQEINIREIEKIIEEEEKKLICHL